MVLFATLSTILFLLLSIESNIGAHAAFLPAAQQRCDRRHRLTKNCKTMIKMFSSPTAISGRMKNENEQRSDNVDTANDDNSYQYTSAAPVYITIGPPCSGKTEALRSYLLSSGYDPDIVFSKEVVLSDQTSVYHRVPLSAFLFPSTQLDHMTGSQLLKSGASVKDRLFDPKYSNTDQELRSIMLRVAGRITPKDFEHRVKELAESAGDTVQFFRKRRIAVTNDLIRAVEEVVVQAVGEVICQMQLKRDADTQAESEQELPYEEKEGKENDEPLLNLSTLNATQAHVLSARELIKTPHVELFVPQAIFNGGISRAEQVLSELLLSPSSCQQTPVSWGNTNTKPTEYVAALSAAEKSGRPVKFIAWGTNRLPKVSRQELLRRNVARFRRTGRYIPAGAVGAALGRVNRLLSEAEKEANALFCDDSTKTSYLDDSSPEIADHKLDIAFASLAGFSMDEDGFVEKVGEPKQLYRKGSSKRKNPYRKGETNAKK